MLFNLNHQHFVSSLSHSRHKYIYTFPHYSNSLANFLMLVYLIIEICMNVQIGSRYFKCMFSLVYCENSEAKTTNLPIATKNVLMQILAITTVL